MSTCLFFPSEYERQAFVADNQMVAEGTVITVGVGKVASLCGAFSALREKRFKNVILIGYAGSYDASRFKPGDVIVVTEETFGDEGVFENGGFRSLEEFGFTPFPPQMGQLRSISCADVGSLVSYLDDHWRGHWANLAASSDEPLPKIFSGRATTVSSCAADEGLFQERRKRTNALIENMEGVGMAILCQNLGLNFWQLRVVSNHCGDRNRSSWDLPRASLSGRILTAVVFSWIADRRKTKCNP